MQPPGVRPSSNLNSRSKPGSSASLVSTTSRASTQRSRDPSRQRVSSTEQDGQLPPDDASIKNTEALIRRVLCPLSQAGLSAPRPLDELLPPLTSSNEVDLQLYAIIAIIMRDFVYSWYGKITNDHSFVEEVISIIAHCTRDLEQRFRRVDLESLFLDEVPALVMEHISAFRTAQSVHEMDHASSPKVVYHTVFPHPALSPAPVNDVPTVEQLKNEATYRQLLVQGILAVLLPTEDLRNPCVRTLVADVFADVILGTGVGGKASEGWLLWDGIVKMAQSGKVQVQRKARGSEVEKGTRSRLEKFGLLSSPEKHSRKGREVEARRRSTISDTFWRISQYCYMTFMTIRFVLVGLFAASSAPSRDQRAAQRMMRANDGVAPMAAGVEAPSSAGKRPILTFSLWGLVSQLLEFRSRMPWTYGVVNLVQWHLMGGALLRVGATNGILDLFLHQILITHFFHPKLLPPLLQALRTTIFPNNALAPSRPAPTPREQRLIKRRAANAILGLVPAPVASRFFATGPVRASAPINGAAGVDAHTDEKPLPQGLGKSPPSSTADVQIPDPDPAREDQLRDIERTLDVFGDKYMNKHLLYAIVELVVVRLVPELADSSVRELMEERIGSFREGVESDGG